MVYSIRHQNNSIDVTRPGHGASKDEYSTRRHKDCEVHNIICDLHRPTAQPPHLPLSARAHTTAKLTQQAPTVMEGTLWAYARAWHELDAHRMRQGRNSKRYLNDN